MPRNIRLSRITLYISTPLCTVRIMSRKWRRLCRLNWHEMPNWERMVFWCAQLAALTHWCGGLKTLSISLLISLLTRLGWCGNSMPCGSYQSCTISCGWCSLVILHSWRHMSWSWRTMTLISHRSWMWCIVCWSLWVRKLWDSRSNTVWFRHCASYMLHFFMIIKSTRSGETPTLNKNMGSTLIWCPQRKLFWYELTSSIIIPGNMNGHCPFITVYLNLGIPTLMGRHTRLRSSRHTRKS